MMKNVALFIMKVAHPWCRPIISKLILWCMTFFSKLHWKFAMYKQKQTNISHCKLSIMLWKKTTFSHRIWINTQNIQHQIFISEYLHFVSQSINFQPNQRDPYGVCCVINLAFDENADGPPVLCSYGCAVHTTFVSWRMGATKAISLDSEIACLIKGPWSALDSATWWLFENSTMGASPRG